MKISVLVTSAFLGFSNLLFAQDPHFTQHFSTGIYCNPAFTGSTGKARLNAAYRNQWPNIGGGGFNTYFMSFDFCKEKLPIDIGIFYLNDRAGGVTLKTNQVGLSLGRSFRMFKNVSLRIGFSGALASRKLDIGNLTFGDPSDPINNSPLLSVNYALINFGMVMHSNRFLLGISASNLNEPNQGFFGSQSRLPLKYTLQGAIRINMNDIENLSGIYISGIYINQQDFNTYLPGIIYRYKFFRAGLAYRYKDAFISNLAYAGKNLSIGYSYDYTVSKLTNKTGGSHEFTINWTFGKLNEKRPGIGFISSLF